ncbi:homing endonuclease associated repeat-containing protein [Loigolactobacillus binensis]|uniref:Homing endonuclease associated repeat-containing protein n=1 Tax=Loigolactobacillus binensis TaxID=2559922 RepID=A0ABW3EE68_9LACO|nr:hypothetical protein [Loigolactobacillus binensis]
MTDKKINLTKIERLLADESIRTEAISSVTGLRASTLKSFRQKHKEFNAMTLKMLLELDQVINSPQEYQYLKTLSKLAPNEIDSKVQRQRLVKEFQKESQFSENPGEGGSTPLKSHEFKHYQEVIRYYGSWNNFLKAQNIRPNVIKKPRATMLTGERLIAEFNQQTQEIGHAPKSYEFRHYAQAYRYFGSWRAFVKAVEQA